MKSEAADNLLSPSPKWLQTTQEKAPYGCQSGVFSANGRMSKSLSTLPERIYLAS